MTVKELTEKLYDAAMGVSPDLAGVTINGNPIRRVDVYNGHIDIVDDTQEENHAEES